MLDPVIVRVDATMKDMMDKIEAVLLEVWSSTVEVLSTKLGSFLWHFSSYICRS